MNIKHIMDPEVAYGSVEKMLHKLAWTTSQTYGIPVDECLSEAQYAFVKALNWRYKPGKGTKFSTCVYGIATWRLRTLVIKRASAVPTVEVDEELLGAAPPTQAESLELIDDLSDGAKEMITLLLETPQEILGRSPMPVSRLLGKVKQYLVIKGRRKEDVNRAHKEIQQRFSEAWA